MRSSKNNKLLGKFVAEKSTQTEFLQILIHELDAKNIYQATVFLNLSNNLAEQLIWAPKLLNKEVSTKNRFLKTH